MTELVLRPDSSNSLTEWAESARQVALIAQSLAKTPFIPASLRDRSDAVTIGNITAAVLTGRELGMSPMAALRSIDVIQGTPALRAITLRALVLAAGHDMYVVESTATRAIVRGQRKGSDQVQESVWTMDRAKALGLAGKENYRKQPAAMLVARATAECARLVAADAILGLAYASEELADGLDSIDTPPTSNGASAAVTAPRRTAQRRTPQRPAIARPPVEESEPDPEPDFDEPAADPAPEPDPITDAQMRKLQALFHDLGINDRNERLAEVGAFLGRDLTSSKELTRDETSRLIDDLQRRLDPTPEDEGQEMP